MYQYMCIYNIIPIYHIYTLLGCCPGSVRSRKGAEPRRTQASLDTLQRGVQSEGGALDWGSII